jgi:hypothetical protein
LSRPSSSASYEALSPAKLCCHEVSLDWAKGILKHVLKHLARVEDVQAPWGILCVAGSSLERVFGRIKPLPPH